MNRRGSGFSFGALSALVALLVLTLASFAMLSYLTARNDLRLSEKTAQSITEYYEADAEAQRLAGLACELSREGRQAELAGYGIEYSGGIAAYRVEINEATAISVRLGLGGESPECLEWSVVSNQEESE